jgi:hypothetical protein
MFKRHISLACRMLCLLLVAGTLAACDRCGDLVFQSQSCREQAPRPQ